MYWVRVDMENNHCYVTMYKNKRPHKEYVHRLVADAFVPNPNKLPVVRHLNDCPDDNYADNLAWGTQTDNVRDMIRNENNYELTESDRKKAYEKRQMPIRAIDLKTGNEVVFESQQEASRRLNLSQSTISHILKGKRKTCKGYIFRKEFN